MQGPGRWGGAFKDKSLRCPLNSLVPLKRNRSQRLGPSPTLAHCPVVLGAVSEFCALPWRSMTQPSRDTGCDRKQNKQKGLCGGCPLPCFPRATVNSNNPAAGGSRQVQSRESPGQPVSLGCHVCVCVCTHIHPHSRAYV